MRTLAAVTLAVILTGFGCARATYQKPGGSAADFEQDKAACSFMARSAGDPILAMLGLGDCLRGKGWTLVRE